MACPLRVAPRMALLGPARHGATGLPAVSSETTTREAELFGVLDEFTRTSSVGEYATRILLLRSFAAQYETEDAVQALAEVEARPRAAERQPRISSNAAASARIMRSLWRYHAQFLPDVEKHHATTGRGPVERKLLSEVQLARWDERSYHLSPSPRRSHIASSREARARVRRSARHADRVRTGCHARGGRARAAGRGGDAE